MLKKCASCGRILESEFFHKNTRNKDGLHSYCKECNKLKAKEYNITSDKGKENVKKAQKKQFDSGYFKYGKGAVNNMTLSAEKRGITFSLNEIDLRKWWDSTNDTCHYCGIEIVEFNIIKSQIIEYEGDDWKINRFKKFFKLDNHSKISEMTIDRVDNSKGYELDNIVKSCWICNSCKTDFFSEKEMKIIGKLIIADLKDAIKRRII